MARFSIPHPNCNGACKEYEAKKPVSGTRYGQGQKKMSDVRDLGKL